MCYSPKLGDAVPKLGSDLGGNPRKVRNYNTYDYNIPDSQ